MESDETDEADEEETTSQTSQYEPANLNAVKAKVKTAKRHMLKAKELDDIIETAKNKYIPQFQSTSEVNLILLATQNIIL